MNENEIVRGRIWKLIEDERQRQDAKWGEQNHLSPTWALILGEEVGEISKALLERNRDEFTTELIQAAAVIVAWLECEQRRSKDIV